MLEAEKPFFVILILSITEKCNRIMFDPIYTPILKCWKYIKHKLKYLSNEYPSRIP